MKLKVFLIALFILTPAASVFAINIGGTYAVEGSNPDGGRYQGTCTISGNPSSGYSFSWSIGSDQFTGTGVLSGNTLTVQWGSPDPVVYKVSPDGSRLDGKWGPGGAASETLRRK